MPASRPGARKLRDSCPMSTVSHEVGGLVFPLEGGSEVAGRGLR